jgi:hypothetical protein
MNHGFLANFTLFIMKEEEYLVFTQCIARHLLYMETIAENLHGRRPAKNAMQFDRLAQHSF